MLSLEFWNAIKNCKVEERPAIVRKYKLTLQDIQQAGKIITSGKLEEEWFNQLYTACMGCGLGKAYAVFDKYGIPEEERKALKSKIAQRWMAGNNTGKFNN